MFFVFCCVNYLNFGLPWFLSCFLLSLWIKFLFCWKFSPILHNNVPKSVCLVIKHYLRWMFDLLSARTWNLNLSIWHFTTLQKCVFLQCLHFVSLVSFAILILKFLFSICWFYALQLLNYALFCLCIKKTGKSAFWLSQWKWKMVQIEKRREVEVKSSSVYRNRMRKFSSENLKFVFNFLGFFALYVIIVSSCILSDWTARDRRKKSSS